MNNSRQTTLKTTIVEAPRIPLSTYFLSLGQAINLIAAVLSVTVAALVGAKLAPAPAYATIPYGLQFAAVMIFTYPASAFMRRYGRKAGFLVGALPLIASGIVGYQAVIHSNFAALTAAHFLLGIYVAFANFYRFAAVDNIQSELKPKAISLVVSGGVLAAIIGPLLAISLRDVSGFPEFALCYGIFVVLGALTIVLIMFWNNPGPALISASDIRDAFSTERTRVTFPILIAIFSAASGYLIMNFLMIQSSLVMKNMHVHFNASSHAIQIHVLAMFAPSFFTGSLISRFGVRTILLVGFFLLSACTVFGLSLHGYNSMLLGLILLGLGWNFTYVGGGALLAQHVCEASRHRWQGINDLIIAVCATMGALSPSILLSTAGWQGSNLICLSIACAGAAICFKLQKQAKSIK